MNVEQYAALAVAGGALALIGALILRRVWRRVVVALAVAGGVGLVAVLALALLAQASATQQTAQVAQVAAVGQTSASIGLTLAVGALLALLVVASGATAVLYLRLRFGRPGLAPVDRWQVPGGAPAAVLTPQRRPARLQQPTPSVVYLTGGEDSPAWVPSGEFWGWGNDGG